jgi:phage host-nuclease inhibitor protein Gam
MKKKLFFKLFIFAVIGALVTVTSCKDYDDDITKLNTELSALKTDMVNKSDLNALKTELEGKITALQAEVNTLKGDLSKYVTKAELDAAKADILSKTVALESYNTFKTWVEGEIDKLKADVVKAATKEELEALETLMNSKVAELRTDLAAHIANFDALKLVVDGHSTAIADIKGDLADQLALINANKDEIAAVKADLAAKYAELTAEIDALKVRVTDLESGLAALDTKVEAYKDELDDKIAALSARVDGLEALLLNVYRDLDHRVYSLTFIPDFTSEDGTPQIVVNGVTEWVGATKTSASEYWAVKSPKGKIYKGVTTLRYKVSPSNVKLSDFEVRQLVHKTSAVRAQDVYSKSDPIVLAGQATLSNGVLSVPVVVEADEYDFDNFYKPGDYKDTPTTRATHAWDYNVSVALQVENVNVAMDNNEKRIITSTEYVKANFDLGTGRIALNDKAMNPWGDGDLLDTSITYADIAGASYDSQISLWNGKSQSGNMTDVLNHTIDLKQYIYSVFHDYHGIQQAMLDWGFDKHVFKFKRVYLQNEGVNQTNDYVNLTEDGVIGVVPAPGNVVNQAAVGRTPIVEVTAVVNGKVHAVGYIKILVTDNFDNDPINFEFTLEDYVLGCNSTYKLTDVDIDAIDFDQIFNHPRIQLGKDAFFAEYKQGGLTDAQVVNSSLSAIGGVVNYPGSVPATVGTTNDKDVWFKWAINPATQSVNLYNYLEGNINNDAPHGTYKVVTTLKSNGYRPDVVITWNFKVTLPTNLKLTPNEVFLSNGIYKLEPTVYGQTPAPKTSTPYEGLLQNAFLHSNNNFNLGAVAGDQTCANYLSPYFVFTKVPTGFHIVQDPQSPQTETGTFEVRKNVTNELAAKIYYFQTGDANPLSFFSNKGFYILLNEETPTTPAVGAYPAYSQAAKDLVAAGWVEVQPRGYINNQPLNWVNLYDPFTIQITYPVKFNFADKYNLWDQGTGEKQQVSIWTIPNGIPQNNNIVIKDFLNNDIRFGTTLQGRTTGLINHYEIAYTTSGVLGSNWAPDVVFDVNNVTTSLPGGELPFGMTLKVDPSSTHGHHIYKWENATGGSVQNAFEIYIPASIKHKWGTLETLVTVVVNPGTGN